MTRFYNWKSSKTGTEINLDMRAGTSSLRDTMEVEFRTTIDGKNFWGTQEHGYAVGDKLVLHGAGCNLGIALPDGIRSAINDDLAEAHREFEHGFWHGTHKYTVHDTTAYGIYNGFGLSVESMIEQIIKRIHRLDPKYALEMSLDREVLRKAIKELNSRFAEQAQATYVPCPCNKNWGDEFKARHQELVDKRLAPGTAEIPAEEIEPAITEIITAMSKERAAADIVKIEKQLTQATDLTFEQARAAEDEYNEINNEGGYGYVPHIISREEAGHLRQRLGYLRTIAG